MQKSSAESRNPDGSTTWGGEVKLWIPEVDRTIQFQNNYRMQETMKSSNNDNWTAKLCDTLSTKKVTFCMLGHQTNEIIGKKKKNPTC